MSSKYPDQAELVAARKRFYELAGIPDPGSQPKPVDEYMERWRTRAAGSPTEAFIARNEQRIRDGLAPLSASGEEIVEKKLVIPAPPPLVPEDDFFSAPANGEKIAKKF